MSADLYTSEIDSEKQGDLVMFSCTYHTLDTTTEEYVYHVPVLDYSGGHTVEILLYEDAWCKIIHPSGKVRWVMREELECVG